jgi:ribosomal-protein-serine acetyltransferase
MRTALSDGTVSIRAYELGMESAVFEAARESIREISVWLQSWREELNREKVAQHVAESVQARDTGGWYDFAIYRVDSPDVLGHVGLDQISNGVANVGYWVRTDYTKQGLATAAVRLLSEFAFEDLGLSRLELLVAVENQASRRIAEKVGATFEGILPAGAHARGVLEHDSYCFSLSRESPVTVVLARDI